jgi:hypothetical protein
MVEKALIQVVKDSRKDEMASSCLIDHTAYTVPPVECFREWNQICVGVGLEVQQETIDLAIFAAVMPEFKRPSGAVVLQRKSLDSAKRRCHENCMCEQAQVLSHLNIGKVLKSFQCQRIGARLGAEICIVGWKPDGTVAVPYGRRPVFAT